MVTLGKGAIIILKSKREQPEFFGCLRGPDFFAPLGGLTLQREQNVFGEGGAEFFSGEQRGGENFVNRPSQIGAIPYL